MFFLFIFKYSYSIFIGYNDILNCHTAVMVNISVFLGFFNQNGIITSWSFCIVIIKFDIFAVWTNLEVDGNRRVTLTIDIKRSIAEAVMDWCSGVCYSGQVGVPWMWRGKGHESAMSCWRGSPTTIRYTHPQRHVIVFPCPARHLQSSRVPSDK